MLDRVISSILFFRLKLLLSVFCLQAFQGIAQPDMIRFQRFSDEEGLPNNLFKEVIQDEQGILWMGGLDGLASYDGYTVKAFRHSHLDPRSLSGNNISTLYKDAKGRLWIGINGYGLNVTSNSGVSFEEVSLPVDPGDKFKFRINDITGDSSGRLWIASDLGLILVREEDHRFVAEMYKDSMLRHDKGATPGIPLTLATDIKGRIWIGKSNGLFMFDPTTGHLHLPSGFSGLPSGAIHDIEFDRSGRVWVSCANKGPRLYYNSTGAKHFDAFDGIPFASVSKEIHFTFDLDNRIWALVFGDQAYGYDFRDSTLFLRTSVNSNISHERFFRRPFVDHSGNVWLPVEGFYILPYPKGFNTYIHTLAFHQSNTCIYGEGQYLWFAYREKGLLRLDRQTGETIYFSTGGEEDRKVPVDHIQDILRVSSGNYILVGFGNISVMNHDGKILASYPVNGTNRAAYEDSSGRIWIGGYKGLHLFSETEGVLKTYTLPSGPPDEGQFIQTIVEDNKGRIWFASDLHGLSVLEPASGRIREFLPVEGDSTSLPGLSVLDIAIDEQNILWLATDVALVRFDPLTYQARSYDRSDGLENDYISAVICAPDGTVWVSTHSGLSSFDPTSARFVNYSKGDGLANYSYYTRSKFLAADGTIYFGGKNGVDYFHPGALRQNPTAPIMFLTSVAIDNNLQHDASTAKYRDGRLDLTYRDQLIEIEITGLHFANQDEVRYWYKMDGLHEDWISLGKQRKILFSNLPPGDYVFRAKAMSGDEVWTPQELLIPIHISPPFYATAWFRGGMVILLITSIILVIRYRERSIKEQDKREAEVKRKMVELEHKALQAQMNPHFIYNSMNSIQQFMIMHDVEGAMKYLTKFSRLLRTVLNFSSQNRIPLSDEILLIRDYVELEKMRFPDKFSYTIDVAPEINIHTVDIPPFFIQPQVENAIRHGLLRKATQGHLQISITRTNDHLHVIVEDNGVGREAALKAKYKDGVVNESKGLTIVEERLSHLHHQSGFRPLTIVDLYDSNNRPAGTRVEIVLPLD